VGVGAVFNWVSGMGEREGGDDWAGCLARHGPALVLFARQWAMSRADAEDVVQEGFVRFWRSRHRANDAAAYLFACVRGCALDWARSGQRRTRRETEIALREGSPESHLLACPVERDERRAAIEAALARLPEPQREVLVMKVWGGLTFPQIGAALGVSPDTAASRYRYAIAKLREQLAEEPTSHG
jgi:RNA polymerase sigma-70 factor (ECF subfamily)